MSSLKVLFIIPNIIGMIKNVIESSLSMSFSVIGFKCKVKGYYGYDRKTLIKNYINRLNLFSLISVI